MAPASALLWRSLRTHQIYGANTEVGKTIFTTTLSKTAQILWPRENVAYLKPVSTGPLDEADERHVHTFAPKTRFHTLYQYDLAESPHSAAPASGRHIPSDSQLIQGIHSHAAKEAAAGPGWLFVETAGGVHSPSPSGTTQAELFKPLRLPAVLIGDSKLGGISQTIASFEALKIRGYDVEAVLLFRERQYQNYIYLAEYFEKHHGVKLGTIEAPPRRLPNVDEDIEAMKEFYNSQSTSSSPQEILSHLDSRHKIRIERLEEMAEKAHKTIWYPFTQQQLLSPANITPIDSAHGNFFQTHNKTGPTPSADQGPQNLLNPSFDGSASWWTQGLGHSNTQLTLAAAYAAGRYGHVMFAQAIHEPALKLAESMLEGAHAASPASRFSRVFYTDNGSSGCEVAVKMALRAARNRYGWSPRDNIEIIGLKGSYHGDTIGVMDCADPNVYNEKVEWYRGRGFWFDYPTVIFKDGFWKVEIPEEWSDSSCKNKGFSALGDLFDFSTREGRGDERAYENIITQTLEKLKSAGRKFGALVMEPVVLGAGGMRLVDPLFQRTLVKVVRQNPHLFGSSLPGSQTTSSDWSGLPVFFDEVFTGLYRLGNFSSGSMLQVDADIVVNAKLLTGGALPMCTTMTSESIFESFLSGDKSDALLHGHSYTAHPMGCQVGVESIKALRELSEGSSWDTFKDDWEQEGSHSKDRNIWSVWPIEFVKSLPGDYVEGAWALGSVLAIYVRDSAGLGYKSTASMALHENLLRSLDGWNIHNRILGNVLYLMVGQNTTMQEVKELCERIKTAIPGPK
ncbi:Bifunctional dethiobiotin synthetase/7,8-diamino-pelargonic acid aminotransferase, mitochondrial [Ceratocystis fimbriata CBS 114723]|uniref:Bifunctional dethiobiotin synthetase/7,8-diamino-pelargonic acid aminotransferase, mitochondrial n=1 Tax=Ceratocystis fimbriata CBS 114723 TaxID=1035309 RepID=A0A2C5X7Q8_9PEZI|nr:Bifunctional dethiobiotin synthetase/7,8-diamino-pelargonic acid aminotransferase, mitochondrial [Ceratocystis fimbriata CBS 114723]